jgi:hypothetical protein
MQTTGLRGRVGARPFFIRDRAKRSAGAETAPDSSGALAWFSAPLSRPASLSLQSSLCFASVGSVARMVAFNFAAASGNLSGSHCTVR